eukprot:scaffold375182_cov20-Prasinocladus_malaysianus.AAC.1
MALFLLKRAVSLQVAFICVFDWSACSTTHRSVSTTRFLLQVCHTILQSDKNRDAAKAIFHPHYTIVRCSMSIC